MGVNQVRGRVGSRKKYAATVHQGSRPHEIRAGGKMLRFKWDRGEFLLRRSIRGNRLTFFFLRVMHPGNKRPVRYLTTPMHMFGRANGFRTTSQPVSRTRLP